MSSPIVHTLLSDTETPISLFDKLRYLAGLAFLFESADGDKRVARFSILGVDPVLAVRIREGTAVITDCRHGETTEVSCEDPLALLKSLQEAHVPAVAELPDDLSELPLTAGWVGYFGYGMTRYFERIPQTDHDVLQVPDTYVGLYDSMVVFDHLYRRIHFVSHRLPAEAEMLWRRIQEALGRPVGLQPLYYQVPSQTDLYDGVTYSVAKEDFCQAVEQCKAYIREGQAFQIVLAQRFALPVQGPPLDIYRAVVAINPSPYAYFLQFPEFTYLGSSPETFVRCRKGEVVLKALAGTRPRGPSPQADEALAAELRANAKEMAEHRMLVDLGRNDLGRVCRAGTVRVGEIAQVIRYSHVMHLATEITGTLREGLSGYDVIRSCFPRGTVSGAPKIRAMQLLATLEPEQRGVYSGMVGYIDTQGDTDGAIAIRSALIKDGIAHVHAGAGVVYHSTPEAEYEETRNKARSIIQAIRMAERTAAHA